MTTTTKPTSLEPCKQHILGHDEAENSVILPLPDQIYHGCEGTGGLSRSFAVPSVPVVLAGNADVKAHRSGEISHLLSRKRNRRCQPEMCLDTSHRSCARRRERLSRQGF